MRPAFASARASRRERQRTPFARKPRRPVYPGGRTEECGHPCRQVRKPEAGSAAGGGLAEAPPDVSLRGRRTEPLRKRPDSGGKASERQAPASAGRPASRNTVPQPRGAWPCHPRVLRGFRVIVRPEPRNLIELVLELDRRGCGGAVVDRADRHHECDGPLPAAAPRRARRARAGADPLALADHRSAFFGLKPLCLLIAHWMAGARGRAD